MKITKIQPQKYRKDRVNIYIDGEFALGLTAEIQCKYGLEEGMKIEEEFLQEILLKEEGAKAQNLALRFLGYRQRSKKEIVDRLAKEGFAEDIIEATLEYLKEYKLVNDLEFAQSFVKDKIKFNNHGPSRIKYDLYRKGIGDKIIDKVLVEDEKSQYKRALDLGEKRMKAYKNDDRNAQYRKLGGYLQRRGFSYGIVKRVLEELVK